ncbi:uncharacterized protein LOC132796249 isoform X1 [Drosophila nasuta]|uniref:uncharacterized protein LOC132796249 isoform X1 n=1 Tax=Drosophila nasuta TaxID=42062 RepID=UPI00295F48E0|nr:uncharacterized protein LOC132796249 isoform X1 [Drosophila nasuta]
MHILCMCVFVCMYADCIVHQRCLLSLLCLTFRFLVVHTRCALHDIHFLRSRSLSLFLSIRRRTGNRSVYFPQFNISLTVSQAKIKKKILNMTSPNLYEEKEVMEEFISCYRHFTALWNTNAVEYLCKKKKQPGYQELLKILRRVNPEATLMDVKRKINSLRCCYRRELKKIRSKSYSGYEPRLWWFHSMDFLQPVLNLNVTTQYVKRDNNNSLSYDDSLDEASMQDGDFFAQSFKHEEDMLVIEGDAEVEAEADADVETEADAEVIGEVFEQGGGGGGGVLKVKNNKLYAPSSNINNNGSKNLQSQRISSAATAQSTSRRRVRNVSYDDVDADVDADYEELMLPESSKRRRQMIDHHQQQQPQHQQQQQQMMVVNRSSSVEHADSECDLIGQRMAAHFRNMRPDQRLFAERIISEVLVYGRMNRLSLDARFLPNGSVNANSSGGGSGSDDVHAK